MDSATEPAAETPEKDSEAKAAIARVFAHLRIGRIVYVDDVFEWRTREVEQVIGLLDEAWAKDPDTWAETFTGLPYDEGREVWVADFRDRWGDMVPDKKDAVVRDLYIAVHKPDDEELANVLQDFQSISVLKDLVPDGIDRKEVGPSEWVARSGELMRVEGDKRVLCLFDRDLRHATDFIKEQEARRGRAVDGVGLLIEAFDTYGQSGGEPNDDAIFGLFSHTFTLEDELPKWREIARDEGFDQDNFLPLSKQRQREVMWLAKGLQMMALNMFCARLKRSAVHCLTEAHEKACEKVKTMEVYNFDEMVLRSSEVEGAWEADAIFRLFQIYHRDGARAAILQPEIALVFNDDVADARAISRNRVGDDVHPPEQLWELRHQELYLSGDLLNPFHAPLRSGDVFRVKRPGRTTRPYLLLAQPCDLAVRTNGTRSARTVTLLQIEKKGLETFEALRSRLLRERGYDLLDSCGLVHYFEGGKDCVGLIKFKESLSLRVEVLDLAVLSADGACSVNVGVPPPCPPQFSVPWQNRYDSLIPFFREEHARLDALRTSLGAVRKPASHEQLWAGTVQASMMLDKSFSPDVFTDDGFDFGVQRIEHYREPGAQRLLMSYTQFLSRPADDHDFADAARRAHAA